MHIDHENLLIDTESDVEQKILLPLLVGDAFLRIPGYHVHTKEYLAPTVLDKAAGKNAGYFPDYSVWMNGFMTMVVEAKAPDVEADVGYREASLYARHINQNYPTQVNPCRFLLACNGKELLFGYWDSLPIGLLNVQDLRPGTASLDRLLGFCSISLLREHATSCLNDLRNKNATSPYNLVGGPALLNAKRAVNSFAAELSPILRRYFSSSTQHDNREIIERAYVSSAEITEYDRILEALLKDRLSSQRGHIVQELRPTRHGEPNVERAISDFQKARPRGGQLQIIQGAVGSGKSLFMQRYQAVLQNPDLAPVCRWAFIDFNTSPAKLDSADRWLCEAFVDSFQAENPSLDLNSANVLRGVFARNIQRRKAIYEELATTSQEQCAVARATDLAKWQDDPVEMASGIADYILGSRREVLIAVMDNVDRLDLTNQLSAFQLALWFMNRTSSFVILQMRDETYERYKDRPPLDTFRASITFHITPPRFVDVVKKRLELSMAFLAENAPEKQTYSVESGLRITYPKSQLGEFLRRLYLDVFDRKRNVSRVLEALAGRNVRRALDMFVSIITSGHISPTAITSTVLGGTATVTERDIIKVLMRTEYRFFSGQSGFIFNIFYCNPDWQRPDNFLIGEILYVLSANRKRTGEIGIEGYFTCRHVARKMQLLGYPEEDTLAALNLLVQKELISADHMNLVGVGFDDSVRILPSGFIHVRVLAARLEYLYGVLATTPMFDKDSAREIADVINTESIRTDVSGFQKARAVEAFYKYLVRQKRMAIDPRGMSEETGSTYLLKKTSEALEHFRSSAARATEPDVLDI